MQSFNEVMKFMLTSEDRMIIGYERMVITDENASTNTSTYCFDNMRVARIVSGSLQWKIDNRIYDVHENDIVLLSNTEYRRITKVYPPDSLQMDVFSFRPETVQFSEECLRVFLGRTPLFRHTLPSTPSLDRTFDTIIDEITSETPSLTLLCALLTCMCIGLMRQVESYLPGALGEPDSIRVKNALIITNTAAYMQNHLAEDLSLEDLARYANMSVSYFTRLFRQHLGVSVHEFLVRRRVDRVTHLLQTTGMDVLEAAFQCGFQSSSGFYRAYRTVTGSAPISHARNIEK